MRTNQNPPSAAALLRKQKQIVVDDWLSAVRANLGTLPEGPSSALINDLPAILDGLIDVLDGKEFSSTAFLNHANSRHLWSEFSAEHLRREYRLLRKVTFAALERDGILSSQDRDLIFDYLDEGYAIAGRRFDELTRFNDRLEKQYLQLLERLVTESAQMQTLAESADGLLDVVRQGMHADAAALLLYQADTMELRLASSKADSPQLAIIYRAAIALAAAAAQTADSTDARLLAVEELRAEARDALEGVGIFWIVFVALPQSGWLPGTLCLGFREKPAFEPVALQLLKVLGERLTIFLSRIDVFEHSKVALERARRDVAVAEADRARLESEGLEREEVAATITHDLRTPLNTAKMGAEVLKQGGARPERVQSVANRVLQAIDRSDRMISNLLDAYRVRSGRQLELTIEKYCMSDLAEEVIRDMKQLYGDRFVLRAPRPVEGFWSRDGMRRVLENLLTNAVKYGAPDTPIVVDIRHINGKMQMSVHNEGPPINPADQARILDAFERAPRGSGAPGWGIGLTFVRGMVHAHGGSLSIESSADRGTTFTVKNPMDSRPFQGGC